MFDGVANRDRAISASARHLKVLASKTNRREIGYDGQRPSIKRSATLF
jgi:hypothetical protein